MYRYYKISQKWAEILGVTETAVRHPDGMYLVIPTVGIRIANILAQQEGGYNLLPAEAFDFIGAIGLNVAEAQASARGELRHDQPTAAENADNAEDAENAENPQLTTDN